MTDSENEPKLCIVCLEEYKESVPCHVKDCQHEICSECVDKRISWGEGGWFTIGVNCEKCQKITCPFCIVVCYDRAGTGENDLEYCSECVPDTFMVVECDYHEWWTCGKHEEKRCGQCQANRNYDLRHGGEY